MQKLDRSGTASRYPYFLLLISVSVVCVIHIYSTKSSNLLCSTGLTTAASIHGGISAISPLAAPALVQGSFPAVAGLAGAGIIPGVNIPAALDPVGVPSECLLLKNMFDPSTEVSDLLNIFLWLNNSYLKLTLRDSCICLAD